MSRFIRGWKSNPGFPDPRIVHARRCVTPMRRRNKEGADTPSEESTAPLTCALCGERAERSQCWDCERHLCAACRIEVPAGGGRSRSMRCATGCFVWPNSPPCGGGDDSGWPGGRVGDGSRESTPMGTMSSGITVLRHDGDPMRLKFGG
ncbi:MAG: hypothetical protein ACYCOU_01025 [Sulfobacillus sp.]